MRAAAQWLNRTADRHRGLALAMLLVGSFSVAHTLNVLFNTEILEINESVAWAAEVGLVIGAVVAFGAGFVVWLYMSFGIFAVMRIRTRELSAAMVTRLTGVAFVFPLAGFALSILVQPLGSLFVANAIYVVATIFGLAVLARALSDATGGGPASAVVAVATPILVALVTLVFVGQSLAG